MTLLLGLISFFPVTVDCYRFESGYVEIWYQTNISHIYAPQESQSQEQDSSFIQYSYHFTIYEENHQDSSSIDGVKGTYISSAQHKGYLIDYIPITLYHGDFHYLLEIKSNDRILLSKGTIEIPPDTLTLSGSDIVLGKKSGELLGFRDFSFIPTVTTEFVNYDTLFSYVEIYGLIPDSLYYAIRYSIIDSTNTIVLDREEKRLKYTYSQIDTFAVYCNDFIDGVYIFLLELHDPASNASIFRSKKFSISSLFDETAKMKFYYHIQYIVSPSEYNRFSKFTEHEKKVYLKKFWKEHNYAHYEKRINDADAGFSTRSVMGRDSERGKFYIKNGPPDEIEVIPMAGWARPFEVWYYYRDGNDVLFCDIKDDGNPRLIKIFRSGELIEILEQGYFKGNEEEWIFDVGPGTYDHIRKEGAE